MPFRILWAPAARTDPRQRAWGRVIFPDIASAHRVLEPATFIQWPAFLPKQILRPHEIFLPDDAG
ncbi:hypothetical protein HOC_19541 [Hyphomonas oceanitis SCH89]|uniref:Uncharacterized protein n=1 Tax=Hyphomonas oceanitis SCH89 TaxID=1280953 RepID=A0A059G2B9_9PROT|nr:hypothetical protein HOC_19541 [Hyphomonas oceanitis SCH89]